MRVPDLDLSQEWVQDDHASCSFIDKKVSRCRMMRETTERVWVSLS